MRVWWTLAELASRKLPGIPTSKQGAINLAKRAGWHAATLPSGEPAARPRQARGGGYEFHVSLLPLPARLALDGAAAPSAPVAAGEIVLPPAACAAGTGIRDARLAILRAVDTVRAVEQLSQSEADIAFCVRYAAGAVEIADVVREAISTVSPASLKRWRKAARSQDGARLGRGHGGARRLKVLELANDGAVAVRIQRLITEQPFFTAKDLRKGIAATFGATLDVGGKPVGLPSPAAFARYAASWKDANKATLLKLTNPDGWRSRYRVSGGSRHDHLTRLNEVWQIDASPADMLVCVEDGRPVRYTIYVCIDIWSRRIVTYVSRTPRAEAVLLLLRKAILTWGVPDTIETDNGSDFKSHETQRFLAATGIKVSYCDAYSPWQKGHVERVIGTVQRGFGVWQPGFIGHSVADRKTIEARKSLAQRRGETVDELLRVELTSAELAQRLDAWVEHGYALDIHSALGMSPFAKAASYAGSIVRIGDEHALDVLLHKVPGAHGLRTVGKEGIKLEGAVFICPSLMPGEKTLVRMDPADLGRLRCFSPDGAQYLGEAVCPERVGLDRAEVVAKWRAEVNRRMADGVAAIRRDQREVKLGDIANAVMRQQAERSGKLVPFPRASDPHETPALAAASEATRKGAVREAKLTDEQRAKHAAMVAEFEAEAAPSNVVAIKPANTKPDPVSERKARYRDWLALNARDLAGETLSDDERRHLAIYPTTSEYRAVASMVADFGPEWLDGATVQRAAQ